jgi:opacity protein-like surface antigen
MRRVAARLFFMVGLCAVAGTAEAQMSLAPFSGQVTGHLGVAAGRDGRGSTPSIGASLAVIEANGFGAEFDAGLASDDDGRGGGLDVQSYMLNAMAMWPRGRVRPFGTLGAGVLRIRACVAGCATTEAWTDWGWSGGAGVHVPVSPLFAVRGEARYFTALGDNPNQARPRGYGFWRVAVGATFIWSEL